MLIVHGIVCSRSSGLPLLVCVPGGPVGGVSAGLCVARRRPGRFLLVVVNDDDLFGQAVLVEVGPVWVAALLRAGSARVHVGGGARGERRELLRLSMGGRGSTQV